MELSFIDNSPTNESERSEVIERFMSYIDKVLTDIPVEATETNTAFFNTQKLEAKQGDLTLAITKQFFKNKPTRADEPQFETINYEISFRVSHFGNGKHDSYDETYKFTKDSNIVKYIERMTSHIYLDGTNTSHNTERHEVSKTELMKMLQFTSNMLEEKV